MAKFMGQVNGGKGTASRLGYNSIRSSVQSWDGSISMCLTYNDNNELMVRCEVAEGESSFYGTTIFCGTFKEFVEKLSK